MKNKVDTAVSQLIRAFYIYNDSIFGAILTCGAAYLFSLSFSIKIMKTPIASVDTPRFFPQLVFGCLIPIGIVLIVRGILKAKSQRKNAPTGEKLAEQVVAFKRSCVALLAITVFIAGMEPIGYIPMAIIYMIFNMFYMSEKKAWKPLLYIIVSVVVAISLYILFREFIYVRLPAGLLKGVLN